MVVRDYEVGDAQGICRLFFETVRAVNLGDYTPEQVQAWAPAPPDPEAWHARMSGRRTLVAEEDGVVVGFAELEENGHLDMLYVGGDAVGRGFGSRLCVAVEERARALGIGRISTAASITARPFFVRRGFRVVRRNYVTRRGVGLTNFSMEKVLGPLG